MPRIAGALLALLVVSCTESGLQPVQPPGPAVLDDRLQIDARVCTSPAVDDFFPVKILFLVDTSDSMSVTDRGATRAKAITDVLARYAGNPSVKFGVIAFDSKIDVLTDGFTNSPDIGKISTRLSQADRLTDYQGVLGAAYAMLSQDMLTSPPADRPRSKYVVIFFSDGTPDPQCSAKGPDPFLICSVPREQWQDAFDPPLPMDLYPDLEAGGDYNQPEQIHQKVDQIVALQDFYHVGEVRLHTAFLFDPAAAMDPLALPFHLDRVAGVKLLTEMSMHGGGTFTEFNSASKISFVNIHYAALKAPFALAAFLATSRNALPGQPAQGPGVDTDGDGLEDREEFTLGTCVGLGSGDMKGCVDAADSDGDGYSDFVEARNARSGFHPRDPQLPSQRCMASGDTDGDGLRDCEEQVLRTDTRLFDSDADRIPDLLEVRAGLDPLDPGDAAADPDRDNLRSADEVRMHTDPLVADQAGRAGDSRYGYEVVATEAMAGERTCYDLTVRDIRLLTTGSGTGSLIGKNRVFLYFIEALKDRPQDFGALRVACVDARYVDGLFKSPPSGRVVLEDKQFVSPARFKPDSDCIDFTAVSEADAGVPDGSGDGGARDGGSDGAKP